MILAWMFCVFFYREHLVARWGIQNFLILGTFEEFELGSYFSLRRKNCLIFPWHYQEKNFICFTGEESNGGDDGYTMEEYLAKMDKVRRESEENRKFWKEELRSMNKWEKYGLG